MNINNVSGVRADISELLEKIRDVSSKSSAFGHQNIQGAASTNFGDVMNTVKDGIGTVSQLQKTTETLKNAYLSGDKSISMTQVVLASEKSKLAFEGLVVVRNKIMEAYKEIMNMPV